MHDIVYTAGDAGTFKILVATVGAAGLVATLMTAITQATVKTYCSNSRATGDFRVSLGSAVVDEVVQKRNIK